MDFRQDLVEAMKVNVSILKHFVLQIPEEQLHVRRSEDCWTIYEHIHHLALVQTMSYRRVRQFVKEVNPIIKAFTPDPEGDITTRQSQKPVSELLDSFASWRKKQVDLIRSASEEIWKRSGTHPEYDQYTFEILIRHILAHDGFHFYRMEELWLVKDAYLSKL